MPAAEPAAEPGSPAPLSEFADTNVVLRYLTGEPEDQGARARALIDSERIIIVTEVVIAEAGHALEKHYDLSRERTVDVLVEFVRKQNVCVHRADRDTIAEALLLCRPSRRVSFGDAMIWAAVRSSMPARLRSFDIRFPREGVEVVEP